MSIEKASLDQAVALIHKFTLLLSTLTTQQATQIINMTEYELLLRLTRQFGDEAHMDTVAPLAQNSNLYRSVDELNFSFRVARTLKLRKIIYIWQLVQLREADMRSRDWPGFGLISVNEVKERLAYKGLTLDMRFS